ncbi:ferritin-like domain-containing protein [Sphingomonas koreensis]|nr:ferritin-like domain-containing protein [Sphingomonas koreensis]
MAREENEIVRSVFVTGLRDAHAVEHQALALMDRQLDRLEHYPEIEARMREHRVETEQQIQRLDDILDKIGESSSALKDAALTMSGNVAALAHTLAGDEILKNSFANFAFENFEAASYKSLITVAEVGGFDSAIPLLRTTLEEELAMARFCDEALPMVTRRFLDLRAAGHTASH